MYVLLALLPDIKDWLIDWYDECYFTGMLRPRGLCGLEANYLASTSASWHLASVSWKLASWSQKFTAYDVNEYSQSRHPRSFLLCIVCLLKTMTYESWRLLNSIILTFVELKHSYNDFYFCSIWPPPYALWSRPRKHFRPRPRPHFLWPWPRAELASLTSLLFHFWPVNSWNVELWLWYDDNIDVTTFFMSYWTM